MISSVTRGGEAAKHFALNQSVRNIESKQKKSGSKGNPQTQPFFQLCPNNVPISVEQNRYHEEASTAGNDRQQDKHPDIVAAKSRGDGHELVGDRRQTLYQDDHCAPFGI